MKHNFKNLLVWQRSMNFTSDIYLISKNFPKSEIYGLTSQLRRATVSLPSNIAEGCGRGTPAQFLHFLNIAIGSSCEVETQLYLSHTLGYMTDLEEQRLTQEVLEIRKMLVGFQKRLREVD